MRGERRTVIAGDPVSVKQPSTGFWLRQKQSIAEQTSRPIVPEPRLLASSEGLLHRLPEASPDMFRPSSEEDISRGALPPERFSLWASG